MEMAYFAEPPSVHDACRVAYLKIKDNMLLKKTFVHETTDGDVW